MKKLKIILSVLFIIIGLKMVFVESILGGLVILFLGVLLLPPISKKLNEKIKIWNIKPMRYSIYVSLFLVFAGVVNKSKQTQNTNKIVIAPKGKKITKSSIEDNFETCNFGGENFYIIPEMNAADVYLNFENKGFKIDKKIDFDNTSVLCELSTINTKFMVIVTGCSPNDIVSIEATAVDYSGNHQKDVEDFLGYVATLQYKNSEPEKTRKWVEDNINVNGAKMKIGGVTFSINFKTINCKFLKIEIANYDIRDN